MSRLIQFDDWRRDPLGVAPLLVINLFGPEPEPAPARRRHWERREVEHIVTEKPLSKRAKRRLRGKAKGQGK